VFGWLGAQDATLIGDDNGARRGSGPPVVYSAIGINWGSYACSRFDLFCFARCRRYHSTGWLDANAATGKNCPHPERRSLCQTRVSESRREHQGPRSAGNDSGCGVTRIAASGLDDHRGDCRQYRRGPGADRRESRIQGIALCPRGVCRGAEVVRTPEDEGMAGAIRQAREAAEAIPESFVALQFQNQSNPDFHHDTTAAEIWEQMEGQVDGFVAGVGTGGTFSGIARFFKERNPDVVNVAVETQGSILQGGAPGKHKVEGIGVSFIPETFHREFCDRIVAVSDIDAFNMVKRLAAEEGLLGGSSAGAIVHAAAQLAADLGPGKRIALIIPDSAERYLSKKIFEGGL